jgi:OPA family sugar phosphate sensor protein UhpC-like MFS transporter
LLGALFAGWGSDLLFSGQRAPMILLFTLGLMVSVRCGWHRFTTTPCWRCAFYGGIFVFGPQMLIGLAAVECGHKQAAGSITGFLGVLPIWGPRWRMAAVG